jgi:hypothetical protein
MVDRRIVNRAQDAVGHVGRPRNLKKMTAAQRIAQLQHWGVPPDRLTWYTNSLLHRQA